MSAGEFLCGGAAIGMVPIGAHRLLYRPLARNRKGNEMQILRQSTAVDVLVGPFLNDIDGNSEQTGLTISQSDVLISKNGQALAQKNDSTACAHDANGLYNCELDATDTNTVGTLTLYVHVSDALAVRHDFQVLEEATYDDLASAGAVGYPTATEVREEMDTNSTQLAAIVADTDELQSDDIPATLAAILDDTANTIPAALTAIETDTQDIQSRIPDALVNGYIKADSVAISGDETTADNLQSSMGVIVNSTATGTPTTTTMADSALSETTDDHYVGRVIIFTTGDAAGIAATITDYDGSAKQFTFSTIVTEPSSGDGYIIV